MKKIKITEQQANMLDNINKKKVLKLTEAQLDRIIAMENSGMDTMVKQASPSNRPAFKRELNKAYETFIHELYSVTEDGSEKTYDKLYKLMEVSGLINNGKLVKDKFNNNKETLKSSVCAGLSEISNGGSHYKAMEVIEEILEYQSPDDGLKTIIEKYLAKTETPNRMVKLYYDNGNYSRAWQILRGLIGNGSASLEENNHQSGVENDLTVVDIIDSELALLVSNDGSKYILHYGEIDSDEFMSASPNKGEYIGDDEDGLPLYNNDNYEIDVESIQAYINDNNGYIEIGHGIEDYYDGYNLVKVDDNELRELIGSGLDETDASSAGAYTGQFSAGSDYKSNAYEIEETTTTVSAGGDSGSFAYDAPAGDGSEFWNAGNKMNKKMNENAKTDTQWPNGEFVDIKEKCSKFPYCEQGVDAIETKKSKNSVISKDIYESVAKKTGLPIESVIKIIDKKKKEYQKNNK